MRFNPVDDLFNAVTPTVEFLNPADVAIDQSGNVWVADFDISGGDSRLHRIDAGASTPFCPRRAVRRPVRRRRGRGPRPHPGH